MKVIYNKRLRDVKSICAFNGNNHCCTLMLQPDSSNHTETVDAKYYAYGEYRNAPLLFLPLPMTDTQTFSLLKRFEDWYGDTEQDAELWALEFQLTVRMLLSGYLVINPKYLLLDEVIGEIQEIVCKETELSK